MFLCAVINEPKQTMRCHDYKLWPKLLAVQAVHICYKIFKILNYYFSDQFAFLTSAFVHLPKYSPQNQTELFRIILQLLCLVVLHLYFSKKVPPHPNFFIKCKNPYQSLTIIGNLPVELCSCSP